MASFLPTNLTQWPSFHSGRALNLCQITSVLMQSLTFVAREKTLLIYSLKSCQCYSTQFTNHPTLILSFLVQHSFNIIFNKLLISINVQISHISGNNKKLLCIFIIITWLQSYARCPIQLHWRRRRGNLHSTVLNFCEIPFYTIMTGFL